MTSYILSKNIETQIALTETISSNWMEENDLLFVTEDNQIVHSSRKVLSMISPVIGKLLHGISPHELDTTAFSIPTTSSILYALTCLLLKGVSSLVNENELLELSSLLEIPIRKLQMTKLKNGETLPSLPPVHQEITYSNLNMEHIYFPQVSIELEAEEGDHDQITKTKDSSLIENESVKEKFSCPECNSSFTRQYNLKRHLEKKHSNINAENHMNNNHGIILSEVVKEEEAVMIKDIPLSCPHCDKVYANKGGLQRHIVIHDAPEGKPFPCKWCNLKFARKDTLTNHVKKHHSNVTPEAPQGKPFKCDLCNSHFARKDTLINHVKKNHTSVTHESTDEKPFLCDLCTSKFSRKESLENHIEKNHTNIKKEDSRYRK